MDAFVLFVDLLGFASLTEENQVNEADFEPHDHPETDDFLTASLEGESPLVETYVRFQVAIQQAVAFAHTSGAGESAGGPHIGMHYLGA